VKLSVSKGSFEEDHVMAIMQITKFEVMYSANQFPPRIWLKNGAAFIGQLIFLTDGAALPPDAESGGQVNLYYHREDFANALEILRHGSPTYLLFNGSGPGNENGIQTSPEPIGVGGP
jgi:hypothetical protein